MLLPLLSLALLQATAPAQSPFGRDAKASDWKCPDRNSGYTCESSGKAVDPKGATLTIRGDSTTAARRGAITANIESKQLLGRLIRLSADVRTTGVDSGASVVLVARTLIGIEIGRRDTVPTIANAPGWRHIERTLFVPPRAAIGGTDLEAEQVAFGIELKGMGQLEARGLVVEPITSAGSRDSMAGALPALVALRASIGADSADTASVIESLRTVERAFAHQWFTASATDESRKLQRGWRGQADGDTTEVARPQAVRGTFFTFTHCHPPTGLLAVAPPGRSYVIIQSQFVIYSGVGSHAVCPSWMLTRTVPIMGDERVNPDATVAPRFRTGVRAERAAVIETLTRAESRFPASNWIVGQRIRYLVTQHDSAGAIAAVNKCAADAWWCLLLDGYVQHWLGQPYAADGIFSAAIAEVPADVKCALTDLRVLLAPEGRTAYGAIPCAGRDTVNTRLWWMADPLYTEPGNERRAEHYARAVEVMLRSAVDEDDPFEWSPRYGGAAVREMFARYGAPTSRMWHSDEQDHDHGEYLRAPRPDHFTTNEYSLNRYHTVPEWSAIMEPFASKATDWEVTVDAFGRAVHKEKLWWPAEHYPRDQRPLLQLSEFQVAFFQRDAGALLAAAVDHAATDSSRRGVRPTSASLILSTAPDSFTFEPMAQGEGTTMQRQLIVDYGLPQLMGMELRVGTDRTAGRTRFGITPKPVDVSAPGSIAMSDVALLAADPNAAWSHDPVSALPRMYGTTTLGDVKKLGVYWETYGVEPTDSLTLAIRVDNLDQPGMFQRLGQALRLVGRTERTVTITWTVARASDNAFVVPGSLKTIGRVAPLDVSSLEPGHYRLTVIVTRAGTPAVSAVRELTITG